MKNEFVADGFARWARGREAKTRDDVPAKLADKNQPQSLFGKIRFCFICEWEVLRGRNHGGKSSPKILW